MSREYAKHKPFTKKNLLFWFAISVGAISCLYLYRNPNIPVASLLPKVIFFGILLTVAVEFSKIGIYKLIKLYKRKKKKERRKERTHSRIRRSRSGKITTQDYHP